MSISFTPRRLRFLTAAATVAVLLTTAACSDDGAQSDKSSKTAKLSIAIQGTPPSLEPNRIDAGQSAYIWRSLYDTLLYVDNRGKVQPNAAERYEYSEDRLTLTLTLRKGMTFSSGAPVNAGAVKATLERTLEEPGPNQADLNNVVASVEAPEELSVVIKLKQPDGSLLWQLAAIGGVIADPATMTQKRSATDPVGSGPYTLDKSATVNGSRYILKKRDDYWNAKAYPFQTVQVNVMGDRAAVVNALRAKEINAGTVDPSQIDVLRSAGLTIKQLKSQSVANLVLADREGKTLKPLGDVRVRQAINMAFDRNNLAKAFLRGAGLASTQVYNPKSGAYDTALDSRYPFDVAKAKKLMAEAGYANGFSVKMPSFVTTKPFEPLIAQSLGAIGIKVAWESVPLQQQGSTLASAKYPMFFVLYGFSTPAADTNIYTRPGTTTNPFKSSAPELTTLFNEANRATDQAKADESYQKINEFLVENAWFAPVVHIGTTWVTGEGVSYLSDGTSTSVDIRKFGVTS
ncbi:ABC transporter substrate-binding protein [Streptomyces sp. DH41]|uniref:ABC transporter substrate-binding protein n=1 Tax=Streptomyces sp. DH41 TaxID=3040125 RepID=UPI0024424C81|nr:ABC transporter substrate-binding protein [Streptomyces sp. DH41]MDG9724372.1 ABC transporter substrate-binding protein [Streptomyces sp. DH41]